MKARLGFAISTMIEPEILIVDEALSVGDAAFQEKCKNQIKSLMTKDGLTFLFVTHSGMVAQQFCKRGIVLKNGTIVEDTDINSAIELYEKMIKSEK